MNTSHKLYLSLVVLLSNGSIIYSDDDTINTEVIQNTEHSQGEEVHKTNIDDQLLDVFDKFFDKQDQTPFSEIIERVINLLKIKKESLYGSKLTKCDEIIKIFDTNKYNDTFAVWAKIIFNTNQDLQNLMSEKTRSYINNIKIQTKIQALIAKLEKKH